MKVSNEILQYLLTFILIALRALKNFTFLLMGGLRLKLFFSNEPFAYFWINSKKRTKSIQSMIIAKHGGLANASL